MSIFDPKVNLHTRLGAQSSNTVAHFDFKFINYTESLTIQSTDIDLVNNTIDIGDNEVTTDLKFRFTKIDNNVISPLNNYTTYTIEEVTYDTSYKVKLKDQNGNTVDFSTSTIANPFLMSVVIQLSEYRIVSYHNIRWDKNYLGVQYGGGNTSVGDTNNYITFGSIDEKSFNTPENPPRILPLDGKYSYRSRLKISSGEIYSQNSSLADAYLKIRHQSGWQFVIYPSNGKLEYLPENSYSSTNSTTYAEEKSFILERNIIDSEDSDSTNWELVSEYSDGVNISTETGYYPYGPIIKDQTNTDHYAVRADKDVTIRKENPDTSYSTNVTLDIYDDVNNNNIRRSLIHYDMSGVTCCASTKAEMWLFCTNSNSSFDDKIELTYLYDDFDDTSSTWNNQVDNFAETMDILDASVIPGDSWRDSYIPIQLSVSAVQTWLESPETNYGMGIKYLNEGVSSQQNPTIASSENSTEFNKPLMVVSYTGSIAGYDDIIDITDNNEVDTTMVKPNFEFDKNLDIGTNSFLNTQMVDLAYIGDPNSIILLDTITSFESLMVTPTAGGSSGIPIDIENMSIESKMVSPTVSASISEALNVQITEFISRMIKPNIFSEKILPVLTFSNHVPISKTLVFPGEMTSTVTLTDHNKVLAESITLEAGTMDNVVITSAWNVDEYTAKANLSVTSLIKNSGNIIVSAYNILGTSVTAEDNNYNFIEVASLTKPVIMISNDPSNKQIGDEPLIATVQVLSPGYNELLELELEEGSIGTILESSTNENIPYPNKTYIISIETIGTLTVIASDVLGNITTVSDGVYIKYTDDEEISNTENGRKIDLVNLLPNHLKINEPGEFIRFFEDFLNTMYYSSNKARTSTADDADRFKIGILEKIYRLTNLHDPDTIDIDFIQFFASYLGYNINISRGDLGNLSNSDLTNISTNTKNDDVEDSVESQKYLRFAIRNLPTWYRIKTTRNAMKVMLFSFGLVGDILTNFTAPIDEDGYSNDEDKWLTFDDRYSDSSMLSQIPPTWLKTPHFSIAVDFDNSPPNWFKQLPLILDAIDDIRPINTVLDEISAIIKRSVEPIITKVTSRFSSTRLFRGALVPIPIE